MRYIAQLNVLLRKLLLVSVALLIVLSVACDNNNARNTAPAQNQGVPANSNGNTQSNVNTPTTNSSTNSGVESGQPAIQITEVPSRGAGPDLLETIAGTVRGVKPQDCKVVVFARTNTWYVQPYIDSSDTLINDDGTWRTDTHLGSEYAALLVKTSYKPPTTTGKLPVIGGPMLAVATANARQ